MTKFSTLPTPSTLINFTLPLFLFEYHWCWMSCRTWCWLILLLSLSPYCCHCLGWALHQIHLSIHHNLWFSISLYLYSPDNYSLKLIFEKKYGLLKDLQIRILFPPLNSLSGADIVFKAWENFWTDISWCSFHLNFFAFSRCWYA